MKKIG